MRVNRLYEIDRVIHSIPEIGMEEYETSAFIRRTLADNSIACEAAGGTGTLVYFQGRRDEIIAFRADIDALPLADNSNHRSPSVNKGFSHACGHSAHTSALLETILQVDEGIKKGTVLEKSLLFIFQPGEEGCGGARYVIGDEVFDKYRERIECFFATHVNPEMDEGRVAVREGYVSAQNVNIKWDIEGQGCHGAQPHTGIDIVVVISELIGAYQTIRSRNVHPDDMYLFTIGKFLTGSKVDGVFQPGGARNIIPNNIQLEGTIRMYDSKYIDISRERIEALNRGYEEAYGIKIDMDFTPNYPAMVNDAGLYEDVVEVLESLGIEAEEAKKMTGSEDFSFYRDIAPTFMFLTGTRNAEEGHTAALHNPAFGYTSKALETIVRVYQGLIQQKAM